MLSEKKYYLLSFYSVFAFYCALAAVNVLIKVPGFNYLVVVYFFFTYILGLLFFSRVSPYNIVLFYFIVILGSLNYFLSVIDVGSLYPFFYLMLLLLTYNFSTKVNISGDDIYKIVVRCFYLYLLSSIVTFNIFSSFYRHFSFDGFLLDRAFHGIEGSPANIDTFASLFIVVVLSNVKMFSLRGVAHITVFLLVIYFCNTQTPLLILLSIFTYKIGFYLFGYMVNRLAVLSIYLVMLAIFYFSLNSNEFYEILTFLTNGRNYIWNEQINNIFSSFTWGNLFYGDFSNAYVDIHWSDEETNNPHNGFLFILLRFGVFFSITFFAFIYYAAKKANNMSILILIALLAASVSNSNVFYLSNPLITLLLIYSFTRKKEDVTYEKNSNLLWCRRA